jgi:hypothetical protein
LGIIKEYGFFENASRNFYIEIFFEKGVVGLESIHATERIGFISEDLKDLLHPHSSDDAKLVQKGLMLYRQGMVKQVQIWNEKVTAMVQDVIPCHVSLHLRFLSQSKCTCPSDGLCRHQMAVFFAAYAKVGKSVADWVAEWREPMKEKTDAANWGLQTAKDLVKANGVMKPDYDRWVEAFEVSFDTIITKKHTSPYVVAELFQIYERRIKASSPVEKEWRLLYELVGAVISFKKLAVFTADAGFAEDVVKRVYLHVFHNLVDDAEDLVQRIGFQSLPFDFDEFILKLKTDVFELLTIVQGLEAERVYLYRHLWTSLFKKKEWRQEEIQKIRDRMDALESWENSTPLIIAAVHLTILAQDDDVALEMVEKTADEVIVPYLIYWIELLAQAKAWKRVGPFIEVLVQKIKGYFAYVRTYHTCASFSRMAMKHISAYAAETGRLDVYERALLTTLPYSYADYEHMLFERRQFDKWAELQAFMGWHFHDIPRERVKVIEKEMPEVLLGLLHQSAIQEINQKNRQSYKMAVRHLKKLRTLYKKLKRQDDFQYFLDTLIEKTKRLRAFHEECRRSKLIEG